MTLVSDKPPGSSQSLDAPSLGIGYLDRQRALEAEIARHVIAAESEGDRAAIVDSSLK